MITPDDCRIVRSWRGLSAPVLLQLTELDAQAIARGDRFAEQRKQASADRLRCIELRKEHGLGLFEKLRMPG